MYACVCVCQYLCVHVRMRVSVSMHVSVLICVHVVCMHVWVCLYYMCVCVCACACVCEREGECVFFVFASLLGLGCVCVGGWGVCVSSFIKDWWFIIPTGKGRSHDCVSDTKVILHLDITVLAAAYLKKGKTNVNYLPWIKKAFLITRSSSISNSRNITQSFIRKKTYHDYAICCSLYVWCFSLLCLGHGMGIGMPPYISQILLVS